MARRALPGPVQGRSATGSISRSRRLEPDSITNPLFPRGAAGQSIELGSEAGEKLRFEVTYLPDTRVISWDGSNVETRVTHFVAYKDGRISGTALDYYAQDDANVW